MLPLTGQIHDVGTKRTMNRLTIFIITGILFTILISILLIGNWRVTILQCSLFLNGISLDAYQNNKGGSNLFLQEPDISDVPNLSGLDIHSLRIENTNVRDI